MPLTLRTQEEGADRPQPLLPQVRLRPVLLLLLELAAALVDLALHVRRQEAREWRSPELDQ